MKTSQRPSFDQFRERTDSECEDHRTIVKPQTQTGGRSTDTPALQGGPRIVTTKYERGALSFTILGLLNLHCALLRMGKGWCYAGRGLFLGPNQMNSIIETNIGFIYFFSKQMIYFCQARIVANLGYPFH